MFALRRILKKSQLALLAVLCLAALTATSVYAGNQARPQAAETIGDPDVIIEGKLTVGDTTLGDKTLTVSGVIDFLGVGTVDNYFTQGPGNNMQINSNVDEANAVDDTTKSQWKIVLGSDLDQFSIRRSAPGSTYTEFALFFVDGDTGDVGISNVATGSVAGFPFTTVPGGPLAPEGRLHVFEEAADGSAATALVAETQSTTGNFAAELRGNVVVTADLDVQGTLTKSAGAFRIDNPIDSTQYLQHSFVESSDMMNVYNGNVTLDSSGAAVVVMPEWFGALNADYRYQLTALGAQMPALHVSGLMEGNQFSIAGGVPGGQVSWQVTGIRQDPYALANPIQVIVDKPGVAESSYLFPSFYGAGGLIELR